MDTPGEIAHFRSQRTHMTEDMSRFFDSDVGRVHVPYPHPLLDWVPIWAWVSNPARYQDQIMEVK